MAHLGQKCCEALGCTGWDMSAKLSGAFNACLIQQCSKWLKTLRKCFCGRAYASRACIMSLCRSHEAFHMRFDRKCERKLSDRRQISWASLQKQCREFRVQ